MINTAILLPFLSRAPTQGGKASEIAGCKNAANHKYEHHAQTLHEDFFFVG